MAQGRAAVQIIALLSTLSKKTTIVHLSMLSLYFQCHNKNLLGFNTSLLER